MTRRQLKQQTKKAFRSYIAWLLAFMTILGAVLVQAFANNTALPTALPVAPEPFMVTISGEEITVSADGTALVEIDGFSEAVEMQIPRYVYCLYTGVKTPTFRWSL